METRVRCGAEEDALTVLQSNGTAPGGIFLHGFRSHCDGEKALALTAHAHSRDRFWVRFDQRFCGKYSTDFARFTVTRAVQDTVAILDWFRQPIVLVGSSLGAIIALQAAQQCPDVVRGLLLIAPAYRFPERFLLTLPEKEIEHWRRAGNRSFPDQYGAVPFTLNFDFYEDLLNYSKLGPWKFDCPVTILHGERDELLPPGDSVELKALIEASSVSLEIVPGGDHRLNSAIPLMCEELDNFW